MASSVKTSDVNLGNLTLQPDLTAQTFWILALMFSEHVPVASVSSGMTWLPLVQSLPRGPVGLKSPVASGHLRFCKPRKQKDGVEFPKQQAFHMVEGWWRELPSAGKC